MGTTIGLKACTFWRNEKYMRVCVCMYVDQATFLAKKFNLIIHTSILTYIRYLPGTFNPVGVVIPLLNYSQKTF